MQATFSKNDLGVQFAHFPGEFNLHRGGSLKDITLAFETWGTLNENKDNVVLVHHSLATSCHLAEHAQNNNKGWWNELVGPGQGIDTDRFFIICVNNLGSCFGSTGPSSINPDNGEAYLAKFPTLSIEDMVRSQHLLLEAMGIKELHGVVGGSMGGMLTLCWANLYPTMSKYIIAISMSHKVYPMQLAHRSCQREAIALDPNWQEGNYTENPVAGLKVARMVSHLFYRGLEEVDTRFSESKAIDVEQTGAGVVSYYHYNSDKFAQQYDANTYITFLDAMDNFNLEDYGDDLFKDLTSKCLIVSTDSDVLYPQRQQQAVYELLKKAQADVKFINHSSPYGHDAFLVDSKEMSQYIAEFN